MRIDMKIEKIKLKNFRGIKELDLVLHPRLNVFFGTNGSGKSTILEAMALMLTWAVSKIRDSSKTGTIIKEKDIRNTQSSVQLEITCSYLEERTSWTVSKTRTGTTAAKTKNDYQELIEFGRRIQSSVRNQEESNLPLFAYYPVDRNIADISIKTENNFDKSPLAVYEDALLGKISFQSFFEWFREREDLENENIRQKIAEDRNANIESLDKQLQIVRSAITTFLPEFSNLKIRRNPLRMEVNKNKEILTINQLSDGEKTLIALIGDLARRLSITNVTLSNPLEGQGTILIDEVDLHLHPKWQRILIRGLMTTFPNCQFILTTHSPHILTHVKPENLFLLQPSEEGVIFEKPGESYGKTVERILEDLMGLETTRPVEVEKDLKELMDLIDENKFDLAKKKILELRESIGLDPELVRADVWIKRKESIGK
jgi:predicted ATP-binding protein involved in virulence